MRKSIEKGAYVEATTSDDDRQVTAVENALDRCGGHTRVFPCRCVLVRIEDINAVMRHSAEGFRVNLGRADVEATIQLHGIGRDNLSREHLRQGNCQVRFPRRSRPYDHDEWERAGAQGLSRGS